MVIPRKYAAQWSNLQALLKSRFLRDGATLASASILLQGLSLLTAPIMARLYGPEAYGLLGLYISITGLAGVPAHCQYHGAVMLPKQDVDALALIKGGFGLSLLTTLALAACLLLPIKSWLIGSEYEAILNWVPLIICMTIPGTLITFAGTWLARKQMFQLLSLMRVVTNVAGMAIAIGLGFFVGSPSGLIWANVLGMLLGGIVLSYGMYRTGALTFLSIDSGHAWAMLKKYREFPLFATPTQFLMQFSRQSPILMLTGFAGPSAVGFFNMSNRLLGLPNTLFTESITTVFAQRASRQYAESGECSQMYRRMFWGLLATTTPAVVILAIIAPHLFAWLLGERWRTAGEYSQILCWLFAVQLVCTPLSTMMTIARRQAEEMWVQIVSCLATIAAMYAGLSLFGTTKAMLVGFTAVATVTQLYYGFRGFSLSNPKRTQSLEHQEL